VSSYAQTKRHHVRLGEVSQIAARRHLLGNRTLRARNRMSSVRSRPTFIESRLCAPAVHGKVWQSFASRSCPFSLIALVRMEGFPHLGFWDRQATTSHFALASDSVKMIGHAKRATFSAAAGSTGTRDDRRAGEPSTATSALNCGKTAGNYS
jgi:hypothetical protein